MSAVLTDHHLQTLADIEDSPEGVAADGAMVDSLAKLGLIAWRDGRWSLTSEGEELLRAPRPG
jgi:hypothetical protein